MKRLSSSEKGFSAIETILILVIIAIIGLVGYLVYNANNTANNNLKVSSKSPTFKQIQKKSSLSTTQSANPYAGWNMSCDSQSSVCLYYPNTWTASNDTSGVYLESSDKTVAVSEDNEPSICSSNQPLSSLFAQYYIYSVASVDSTKLKLDVVGGYFINTAPTYNPGYYSSYNLISIDNVNKYGIKAGTTVNFPEGWACYDYGAISGDVYTEILGDSPYKSGNTTQQALSWFSTANAADSLKILKSVYTK